jgi:hypothetical protein
MLVSLGHVSWIYWQVIQTRDEYMRLYVKQNAMLYMGYQMPHLHSLIKSLRLLALLQQRIKSATP